MLEAAAPARTPAATAPAPAPAAEPFVAAAASTPGHTLHCTIALHARGGDTELRSRVFSSVGDARAAEAEAQPGAVDGAVLGELAHPPRDWYTVKL